MQIAESCEAGEGWCRALEGHVLHSVGRVEESETRFRDFIETAPDSIRCRYADATRLLGRWSWMEVRQNPRPPEIWTSWQDHPCGQRLTVSDTLWWLADPLYIVDGNDRWAEHIDRMLVARWRNEIQGPLPTQRWPHAALRHLPSPSGPDRPVPPHRLLRNKPPRAQISFRYPPAGRAGERASKKRAHPRLFPWAPAPRARWRGFAAFDASDAAHGCEQGDYHPLCSLRCLRRRPWLRTR